VQRKVAWRGAALASRGLERGLISASNSPRSIYWKTNMTRRLSGHFSIFGLVFFVLKSVLGIARQWSHEKFAILTLKPRGHVKILIYRTWAIPPSSQIMASEADLRLLSRAALAWLLATPRMESLLAGFVASETRPCCCCWVLFGKRLLKLTFSFYQSSRLTKSFPGFQWDIFFRVAGNLWVGRWLRHLLPQATALGDKSQSPWKAGLVIMKSPISSRTR